MEIRVNVKRIGKKQNGVREVRYEIPGCPGTVEELIRGVTAVCVGGYNRRKESAELIGAGQRSRSRTAPRRARSGSGSITGRRRRICSRRGRTRCNPSRTEFTGFS